MKYNVGDEVLLKANVRVVEERNGKCNVKVQFEDNDTLWFCERVLIPVSRNYDQGMTDAWELAKKLELNEVDGGLPNDTIAKAFGCTVYSVFEIFSPQEALAKLKAYEEQKVLTRGDEVICLDTDEKAIFIGKSEGSQIGWFLLKEYDVPQQIMMNEVKKTGKHIKLASILEQIGE